MEIIYRSRNQIQFRNIKLLEPSSVERAFGYHSKAEVPMTRKFLLHDMKEYLKL